MKIPNPNTFWFKLLIAFSLSAIIFATAFKADSLSKYSTPDPSQQLAQPQLTDQDRKNYLLEIDLKKISRPRDTFVNRKKSTFLNVPVKFSNHSSAVLRYLSMSCGWDEIFAIDNKAVGILSWACDKNVPTIRNLLPGKSETYNVPVFFITGKGAKNSKFRIGINLIIINKQNQDSIFDFDFTSRKKENMIWSNEVIIN